MTVCAYVPQFVPEKYLMKVNGITVMIQSVVQFAAPALTGAVLTLNKLNITLFIDISTSVVGISIFSFVAIPHIERKEESTLSSFEDLKHGSIRTSF